MIANILVAVGFFGIGFFTGIYATAALMLKKYKEYSKQVILLFEEYADKL